MGGYSFDKKKDDIFKFPVFTQQFLKSFEWEWNSMHSTEICFMGGEQTRSKSSAEWRWSIHREDSVQNGLKVMKFLDTYWTMNSNKYFSSPDIESVFTRDFSGPVEASIHQRWTVRRVNEVIFGHPAMKYSLIEQQNRFVWA